MAHRKLFEFENILLFNKHKLFKKIFRMNGLPGRIKG